MSMLQDRTALVTGASAGIGKAFAIQLARRGCHLVLVARRLDRLQALRDEILADHAVTVHTLVADLARPEAGAEIFAELSRRGIAIDVLVNNAGFGVAAKYVDTTWAQQAAFIQVLVTAVAELTHRALPGMLERDFGHIINVASLAGLTYGTPGATLYSGAKSFVIKMTEALSLELRGTGVRATAVCPGFTFSEFHDVNGMRERVSKLPSALWMDADTVARQGLEAALEGRDVYVNGAFNKLIATAMRHLPAPVARELVLRQSKNFRPI
jgi:short-subunit dehydrogenase